MQTVFVVLQLPADFLFDVAFNDVADFDVVEILNIKTAFESCADFFDIIFEAFE